MENGKTEISSAFENERPALVFSASSIYISDRLASFNLHLQSLNSSKVCIELRAAYKAWTYLHISIGILFVQIRPAYCTIMNFLSKFGVSINKFYVTTNMLKLELT